MALGMIPFFGFRSPNSIILSKYRSNLIPFFGLDLIDPRSSFFYLTRRRKKVDRKIKVE